MSEPSALTGAPEIRPDIDTAIADLRELRELSTRFGFDLFGCLASLTKGGLPHFRCKVSDSPAPGADYVMAHFKLAEHLEGALAALRVCARNSNAHIGDHGIIPLSFLAPSEPNSGSVCFSDSPVSGRVASTYRLADLVVHEHPLHSIQIRPEILEAAEEIVDLSDVVGIEKGLLLFLIRFLIYAVQQQPC